MRLANDRWHRVPACVYRMYTYIWPNGIIFHQPRFPWNKGISLPICYLLGARSCEVAIIWPDICSIYINLLCAYPLPFTRWGFYKRFLGIRWKCWRCFVQPIFSVKRGCTKMWTCLYKNQWFHYRKMTGSQLSPLFIFGPHKPSKNMKSRNCN